MKKRNLAERSGREYPHNAIYEILTHGVPEVSRREPKKYSKKTLNEFTKMMNAAPEKTKQAYELVFANGNTLKEAGTVMKISPTTVKNYMMNIYFVRDEFGYMVANLERTVRGVFKDVPAFNGTSAQEHIKWWLQYHCNNKHGLSNNTIVAIIESDYEGLTAKEIGNLYDIDATTVSAIVDAYKPFKRGRVR